MGVASCRQLLGADERSTCEAEGEGSSCETCLRTGCCDAWLGCRTDEACRGLFECLAGCSSEACRVECRDDHPDGFGPAFAAVASCQVGACAGSCGAQDCGGYVYEDEACATCAKEACCDQAASCGANAECLALTYCAWECGEDDHECRGECERVHPTGASDTAALGACVLASCGFQCGYPDEAPQPDWSCLEGSGGAGGSGAGGLGGASPFVEVVVETNQPDPPAGAPVLACLRDDPLCDPPVAEAELDAEGNAILTVPVGFFGYVDVSASDYMGVLWYATRPFEADDDAKLVIDGLYTVGGFEGVYPDDPPIDPEMGHIYAPDFHDCSGVNAESKVTFTIVPPPPVAPFVPISDLDGSAEGFTNVVPGNYELLIQRKDNGQCVASHSFTVRAGYETQLIALRARPCESD